MKEQLKQVIETKSESLKNGYFNKEELLLYKIPEEKINIILDYQNKLPVLQQDNDTWINTRDLWQQLGVGANTKYADWIKQQIKDMDLEEGLDYFIDFVSKRKTSNIGFMTSKAKTSNTLDFVSKANKYPSQGGRPTIDYIVKVSTAKEIAMVAGAKGGNTSAELKENSKLTRKYFIAIEEAFKKRNEWNYGRKGSLNMCRELRGALIAHNKELLDNLPTWIKSPNTYQIEFTLLNSIIIGMSAQKYREINKLKPNESIRNHFNDDQLDYVERLERYDAQLINTQHIFNYESRKKILEVEFNSIKRKTVRYI